MTSEVATRTGTARVFSDAKEMRSYSRELRSLGKRIGFVPTMGFLHEGHLSLIRAARVQCDEVIVSIYINPTQFSVNEDFGRYPRDLERDLDLVTKEGCAAVFTPHSLYYQPSQSSSDALLVVGAAQSGDNSEEGHSTWVTVDGLTNGLCSDSRPTFFRGVTTVVTKLFNIVEPDAAFFGKKDYQQWRILERMARDLDFGIEIVGMPIQREPDGVAMSSRNVLLSPNNRAAAPAIYAALSSVAEAVTSGMDTKAGGAAERIKQSITQAGAVVDYVEIVDAKTLRPIEAQTALQDRRRMTLIAVAAFYGKVRLIDNIEISSS